MLACVSIGPPAPAILPIFALHRLFFPPLHDAAVCVVQSCKLYNSCVKAFDTKTLRCDMDTYPTVVVVVSGDDDVVVVSFGFIGYPS